jgi:phosphoserine phosphatase RsbU/P
LRKFALLLLLAPVAGFSQSLVTIAPQDCVWHTGDDPDGAMHWAAADLDESGWKPYTLWKLNPDESRIWIRCQVDLSPLHGTARPALQLDVIAAYELFVNGRSAGTFGNMETGNFTGDVVQTFPLATPIPVQSKSTIALRELFRGNLGGQFGLGWMSIQAEWMAGDRKQLEDRRNSLAFVNGSRTLPTTVAFFIVGIAGVMMLGLYLSDRSRPEFLFFAFVCWALSIRRIMEQLLTSLYPIPLNEYRLLDACLVIALTCYVLLVYALARKPVPWFYRCVIGLSLMLPITEASMAIVPAAQSLRMLPMLGWNVTFANVLFGVSFLSPFAAFRPWRQITGSMRYVAAVLMVWAVSNEVYIAFLLSRNFAVRSVAPFVNAWWPVVQEIRATLMIAAIVVLLVLLFRDQRKMAEERAQLAGEMDAAREVQEQLVVPAMNLPGFEIESAYLPAKQVGGDFFRVLPGADGGVLVVVGDVSGKGLKAAMTVSAIMGALRDYPSRRPTEVLAHLNRVLIGQISGFVTCCAARISPDGAMIIANAGNPAPYRNGEEMTIEAGLPLGMLAEASYADMHYQLAPGDRLTFVSDGVIEATGPTGELYGFERTKAISSEAANQIADAAQAFGQEDDITVLTLARI